MNWCSGQSVDEGSTEAPPIARIRCCAAAIWSGLESDARGPAAIEHVDRIDEAHGLRLVGHHERVGPRAAAEEANAFEEVARRDAGRREDEVLARGEVLGPVDAALVAVAHSGAAGPLVVVAVLEPSLDLAT